MVEVRLPTMLRVDAEGSAVVETAGATVGEVLEELATRFPALGAKILSDDGSLHRFVNVYVNDDDVRYLDKLDTALAAGDVVSIMPAVAGG